MSDNEIESYMEELEEEMLAARGRIPIVGPVSPNPNLHMVDYAPLFSSSITSLDGGSQGSYSDSEFEMNMNRTPSPRFGSRSEIEQAIAAELEAADIAQSLENWRSALRTVPATTDLTLPQTRLLNMGRSPSPSSPYSASPSTSISQLIQQRTRRVRRLQMLNSMIQDLQDSLPAIGERRRRHRNRRRRIVHFEDHDHYHERFPSNAYAEVLRRGNSMSDCSQCSSAEEDAPIVPSHLVEWSYPGPTN
ncbi:uncharacterized protein LOC110176273 [Drosophila serrata]|uniref:uncharacterized protein LOC110176273 n=1 Tax=Drosophila serrata TaxID=7274 RepID=UPI000A1D34F7|nr:uncharacterized protein LOC110176273 [Drosophila serrata]